MEENHTQMHVHHAVNYKRSYSILAFILIAISSLAFYWGQGSWMESMRIFMGLFFLVFGAFKIASLKEFATTYAEYDLIAKKFPNYGYIYPFIELALGLSYIYSIQLLATNLITSLLMIIGSLGILQTMKQNKKIMCACLGTVVKLPLTHISLLEDVLMGAMALSALVYLL